MASPAPTGRPPQPRRAPTALALPGSRPRRRSVSPLERAGLVAFAFWVPLDSRVPVGGTGLGTLLLIGMLGAVLLARAGALARVGRQAPMVLLYLMLACSLVVEIVHPTSSLGWWSRLLQVVFGVLVVAAVARDARTMRAAAQGIVLGGVFVAVTLTLSSWSSFASLAEADATATSQARTEALDGTVLGAGSINTAAIFTSAAGAVAIAMALTATNRSARAAYAAASLTCYVGAAFSVSRGALLSGVVAGLVAVFSQRRHLGRRAVTVVLVVFALFLVLPGSVFGRVTNSSLETPGGKKESRLVLWEAVGQTLDQTFLLGVGAGVYSKGGWAVDNGFAPGGGRVPGTHSSVTQMLVFWGIVPVGFFLAFVVLLFTKLREGRAPPELRLPVTAFLVALSTELVLSHSLQGKQYALGFGLAVAMLTWFPSPRRGVH